jgi:hypothetical protein
VGVTHPEDTMNQAEATLTTFDEQSKAKRARYQGPLFLHLGQWWIDHTSVRLVRDGRQHSGPPPHDIGVSAAEHDGCFLEGQMVEFEIIPFMRGEVYGIQAVNLVATIGAPTPLMAPQRISAPSEEDPWDEWYDLLTRAQHRKRWRRRTAGFGMIVLAFTMLIGLFVLNRSIGEFGAILIAYSALSLGVCGVFTAADD